MFFFSSPLDLPSFSDDVDRLYRGLKEAGATSPHMTVSTLATLLFVGSHQKDIVEDQLSLRDVAKRMSINYSSLTRHADILGEGIGKRGGMGLLERGIDPRSPKGRVLTLTTTGVMLIRSIEAAIAD